MWAFSSNSLLPYFLARNSRLNSPLTLSREITMLFQALESLLAHARLEQLNTLLDSLQDVCVFLVLNVSTPWLLVSSIRSSYLRYALTGYSYKQMAGDVFGSRVLDTVLASFQRFLKVSAEKSVVNTIASFCKKVPLSEFVAATSRFYPRAVHERTVERYPTGSGGDVLCEEHDSPPCRFRDPTQQYGPADCSSLVFFSLSLSLFVSFSFSLSILLLIYSRPVC